MSLAVATAAAGIAIAIAGASAGRDTPAASPSVVTPDDYCYVEAMIYYRVEESDLARTLLRKEGVDADAAGFATGIAARNDDELEDLREWYVEWADARPAEPPAEGPCAGHGADHAQMPGMPAWSRLQSLVNAEHPEAERQFAEILRDQNAGMVALVELILDDDPHPEVRASAERVLAQVEADRQALAAILDAAP